MAIELATVVKLTTWKSTSSWGGSGVRHFEVCIVAHNLEIYPAVSNQYGDAGRYTNYHSALAWANRVAGALALDVDNEVPMEHQK